MTNLELAEFHADEGLMEMEQFEAFCANGMGDGSGAMVCYCLAIRRLKEAREFLAQADHAAALDNRQRFLRRLKPLQIRPVTKGTPCPR